MPRDRKAPLVTVDLLNDRVNPFLDEHDLAFKRVLTDFALNIAVRLNVTSNTSCTSKAAFEDRTVRRLSQGSEVRIQPAPRRCWPSNKSLAVRASSG